MYLCVSVRLVSETESEKEGKEEGALNVDVLGRGYLLGGLGAQRGEGGTIIPSVASDSPLTG